MTGNESGQCLTEYGVSTIQICYNNKKFTTPLCVPSYFSNLLVACPGPCATFATVFPNKALMSADLPAPVAPITNILTGRSL